MSMGLHSAREELGLPAMTASSGHGLYSHALGGGASSGFLSADVGASLGGGGSSNALPKPISLSPRTFGMEDLRDFAGPVNSFKTGLTPRVFSTGLTPRSGFTPRFTTGFTPRVGVSALGQAPDTSSGYLARAGAPLDAATHKISPSGFTPKDVGGAKVPMRFPGAFSSASPPKMEPYKQEQQHQQEQPSMQQLHQHMHPSQVAEMQASMGMPMYDYMARPVLQQQPQQMQMQEARPSVTPNSASDRASDQEDLDERRRMKNRERVRKCRKRKQDRLNFLEDRTAALEQENGALKAKMARTEASTSSPASSQLTDAELKERRKQHNTTLANYARVYSAAEDAGAGAGLETVFADAAEVLGAGGERLGGLQAIAANRQAARAHVFARYELTQEAVHWKPQTPDRCVVNWAVTATLRPDARRDVPLAQPLAALAPFFGPAEGADKEQEQQQEQEPLRFHMTSHVTFAQGKVLEEIRHLQLAALGEQALRRFAQDPKQAAEALRCVLQAV